MTEGDPMISGTRIRTAVVVVLCVCVINIGVSLADDQDRRKIVMFLDGTPVDVQKLIVSLTGSKLVHVLSLVNALAIELPLGPLDPVLSLLLSNPAVLGIFDDVIGTLELLEPIQVLNTAPPEDFDWGLRHISAPEAQQENGGTQGTGVTVAVLDTGIDLDHPELGPRIAAGYNAMRGGGSFDDNHGHGTHISGIIAAALNQRGTIGAAPQAKLVAVKVLDQNARGYLSDLLNGLQWVQKKGIRLVNMSIGYAVGTPPLEKAIARLHQKGVIMVAAAGNRSTDSTSEQDGGGSDDGGGDEGEGVSPTCDSSDQDGGGSDDGGGDEGEGETSSCAALQTGIRYPARYGEVLAVSATDVNDHIAGYSLSGPEVDLAAPGGEQGGDRILSTTRGGGYGLGSGTSQAAAHVTGAIALALQRRPTLTAEEARSLLRQTAWDLGYPETQQGGGLIDVQRLIKSLQ
jgi:subtilisin family serine protease